jgi:lipopolysaccharide biosynthesis regulator YciM
MGASREVLHIMDQVEQADQKLATLSAAEQLRLANKNGYQCSRCDFGPVLHFACPSLSGAPSTNRCPSCDFYADSLDFWCLWDGKIAESALV